MASETEWVEIKRNNDDPQEIGEYISALANSASLMGKVNAYLLWGVEDDSHQIVGTNFCPSRTKVGNEELENWLLRSLQPKINFHFYELTIDGLNVVLLEIGSAFRHPVQFKGYEYIRVGSYKRKLKDFPEKKRALWRIFDQTPFESQVAIDKVASEAVLKKLDYPSYFDLLNRPLPDSRDAILSALHDDQMIGSDDAGNLFITNLGAILFAKKMTDFQRLKRKAMRVIIYKGIDRTQSLREWEGHKGYAVGFEGLIGLLIDLLPNNEVMGKALRNNVPMFPEVAIRELVANALIHQDFEQTGTGPMIEIFSNRMEITNPGAPLVATERFVDSPPKSRNEALASFMRRIGVCEERGSGIDKVVFETELYQLPAPVFEETGEHTRCVLFSHREFREMDKHDRIWATYLHACLRYVQRDFMTNTSLRQRFGFDEQNAAMASRLIKDALVAESIRPFDKSASKKYMKYVPWWA